MKAIREQSLRQSFTENMVLYPEDYPVQKLSGRGVYWTEDAVASLISWVVNEYDNYEDVVQSEDETLAEWAMVCCQAMYDHLELEDGDYDEPNAVWLTLKDAVMDLLDANF